MCCFGRSYGGDPCSGRYTPCFSNNRIRPAGTDSSDIANNNDRRDLWRRSDNLDVDIRRKESVGRWAWSWCHHEIEEVSKDVHVIQENEVPHGEIQSPRYVNGGGKENGVAPKPILHNSTPNLSVKSEPSDATHNHIRTPERHGTAPEARRSPQYSATEDHLSLRSVSSSNTSIALVNQNNDTPPPPSPRSTVEAVEDLENASNEATHNESTERNEELESTVPVERVEVEDIEIERDETLERQVRTESEASESSQETQASGNDVRPKSNKSPHQPARKKKSSFMAKQDMKSDQKLYPESLPPYSQPREALARTLLQLDNPEWEVIMQGLEGLVRLARHHSKTLVPATHQVAIHITKHIKALRSQVARAACQASQQLFNSLGRALDQEVEEMTGALLSRMADTNRFLRADSSLALDTLVDNAGSVKSVHALVNRGSKHQNAIVRGATCRLLLRICTRLGTERTMSLPKDTRDSILITGAKCLTEGSLDTRRYAKEMFTLLSSDSRLRNIMSDVVPNNILRQITKVMSRIPLN